MASEPSRNGTGSGPPSGLRPQPPTSRPRDTHIGDPSASSELRLGEFQDVPTFSLSEAQLVINSVLEQRRKLGIPFQETE
jgi:DNA-directed RNA polymerase II subunit RPB4